MRNNGTSRSRFVVGSAAALATIGSISAPAKAAQYEWKCASDFPLDHPTSIRLTQMWKAIETESGGRLRVQFFPNSSLGSTASMFSQLRLGALQFVLQSSGTISSVVPVTDISYCGFVFKDATEGCKVTDGPLGTYMVREADAKGLKLMRAVWDSGMLQITSSLRPIRTPEDLKGFKIRVLGSKIASDLFKTLGANPVTLSLGEIYSALQTHVVDGNAGPFVTVETARWYEVQKYMSVTNHAWSNIWLCGNGDAWKSLPPDLQAILERNNTKFAILERRDTKQVNAALSEKLSRQGLTMNQVDQGPFRALLKPYYDYWAKEFGTAWGLLQDGTGRKYV